MWEPNGAEIEARCPICRKFTIHRVLADGVKRALECTVCSRGSTYGVFR